jgi:hypothetical protein
MKRVLLRLTVNGVEVATVNFGRQQSPSRLIPAALGAATVIAFASVSASVGQSDTSIAFHTVPGRADLFSNKFSGGYILQYVAGGSNRPAHMFLLHPSGVNYKTIFSSYNRLFELITIPIGFDPSKAYTIHDFPDLNLR